MLRIVGGTLNIGVPSPTVFTVTRIQVTTSIFYPTATGSAEPVNESGISNLTSAENWLKTPFSNP